MSAPLFDDPTEGLGKFFDSFWGNNEGIAYLPIKEGQGKDSQWTKYAYPWPLKRQEVIQHVLANSAAGKDVYFGPALYKSDSVKDKTVGQREGVLGSQYIWVDFDGNAPNYEVSHPAEGTEEAPTFADTALSGLPAPTMRVKSSLDKNQHFYWRLDHLVTDYQIVEEKNRALAYTANADTGGWDITQVLRPPHTLNHKYEKPQPVEVIYYSDISLRYGYFDKLKSPKQIVQETEIGDVPQVERVIAKYKWDDQHFDLFMSNNIPVGERSSALMRLGYFGAEQGMSNEEIYSILLHADDRWEKFKKRHNRQKLLLDIVNVARQKYPYATSSDVAILTNLLQGVETVKQEVKYVYGFREFLETDIHIEWAVEGLIELGGHSILTGASGVGKTGFGLTWVQHMALGKDFLGWKTARPLKLAVLSMEMNHAALKYFGETTSKNFSHQEINALNENLLIIPIGGYIPFDQQEGKTFIESILADYRPDGLLIDSLGRTTMSALSEEKVKELNAYFVRLRAKYEAFLLFIHHNRKANGDNKKPTDLADLYGSQYIAAEATSVISLWRDKGVKDDIEFNVLKSRLAREPDPFMVRRSDTLSFSVIEAAAVGQGLLREITNDTDIGGKGEQPKSGGLLDF